MEIEQGRYHQVRRMCERIGHPVQKLKRVSLGPIKLGKLRPGQWRFLSREEVAQLKGMAARAPEPPKKRCIK
jgi:16S rRNA U516 pseudouridylate synthase RsuA-like enzyme